MKCQIHVITSPYTIILIFNVCLYDLFFRMFNEILVWVSVKAVVPKLFLGHHHYLWFPSAPLPYLIKRILQNSGLRNSLRGIITIRYDTTVFGLKALGL
jgi:hypothetical protein